IATRRLDMSGGRRTNPDIRPCRRNSETLNSKETLLVADSFDLRIPILELAIVPSARVARSIVADVVQTSFLRRLSRFRSEYGFDPFVLTCLSPRRPHEIAFAP